MCNVLHCSDQVRHQVSLIRQENRLYRETDVASDVTHTFQGNGFEAQVGLQRFCCLGMPDPTPG